MTKMKALLAAAVTLLTAAVVAVGVDIVADPAGTHFEVIAGGSRASMSAASQAASQMEERDTSVSRELQRNLVVIPESERGYALPGAGEAIAQAAYDAKIHDAWQKASVAGLTEDEIWDAIALCETGGKWDFDSGAFSGGLGFANAAWATYGDGGRASQHTREEQIAAAEKLKAAAGGSYAGWGCAVHYYGLS